MGDSARAKTRDYAAQFFMFSVCLIVTASEQVPLVPVIGAIGTSGGSPVSYGGFGGFQGSFLYEPFGRHESQLFIGCYVFYNDDDLSSNQGFLQFSLVAKKDAPIEFRDCWQFCMFKNPRKGDWFKPNYIGLLTEGKRCVCFNGLLERFRNVPIPTCTSPCKGVQGEACKDNTMQVYVPCYPGFYRTPYCEAQCPSLNCTKNEYLNSQYTNITTTFCSTVEGDCIKLCAGKSACFSYTPVCATTGGRDSFNTKYGNKYLDVNVWIKERRKHHWDEAIVERRHAEGWDFQISCGNIDHFIDRKLIALASTTTQQQAWYSQVIATTTDVGYLKLYILNKRQNVDPRLMQSKVVASMHFKDMGFGTTHSWPINIGDVNEDGEQLLTMGDQDSYFGFGVGKNAKSKFDCHVYNWHTHHTRYPYAQTYFSRGIVYRVGDLVTSVYVEPGSAEFNTVTSWNRYFEADILLSAVYVCSSGCAKRACDCEGRCRLGCDIGFLDSTCATKCPTGTFGLWCRYPCSPYCRNQMCDPITGVCTLGCSYAGLKGAYCTEVCEKGTHGDNCLQQCSQQCDNPQECSYLDGTCLGGCKVGYSGQRCDTPCVKGTYGRNCSNTCGSCINNAGCDSITGACTGGCDGGKAPPMCQCARGFFGDKCQYKCGICLQGFVCDASDGCCTRDPVFNIREGEKTAVILISEVNDTWRNIYKYPAMTTTTMTTTVTTTTMATTKFNGTTSVNGTASPVNRITPVNGTTSANGTKSSVNGTTSRQRRQKITPSSPANNATGEPSVAASTWAPQPGITGWFAQSGQNNTVVYTVANKNPGGVPIIITIGPDRPTMTANNVTVYIPMDYELANMAAYDVNLKEILRGLLRNINRTKTTGTVPCGDGILSNISVCNISVFQSPSCVCQQGFFGDQCSGICGYCAGEHCKHSDGLCLDGCQPGYVPNYCKDKCPVGFYGNCRLPCGRCLGGIPCDHVTGQCVTGCVVGFKAPMCQVCLDNYYDVNCTKKCGSCWSGGMCNKSTGYCDQGCASGYEGPFCVCRSGFWGLPDCQAKCGFCKGSTGCNPQTGKCKNGCEAGYTTEWCNQTCPAGTYGQNCGISCGNCFNKSVCDPVAGSCPIGCNGNFRQPKCICLPGTYTDTCKSCGNCNNGTQCNTDTGVCSTGCQLGYRTPMCVCKSGTWSPDCAKNCGQCADNVDCDLLTGECKTGCTIGYTGKMCLDLCPAGSYGKNCTEKCGNCVGCKTCDPITGYCNQGCKLGYLPPLCVRECVDQTYGALCKQLCGRCVKSQPCRKSDGKCLNGCMQAFVPPLCVDPCPDGFYGSNCLATCGRCANGEECNKVDGSCPQGCSPGYVPPYCDEVVVQRTGATIKICDKNFYGSNCQEPCGHCHNERCDSLTGLCVEGCKPGYLPLQCKAKCSPGWYGLHCAYACGHCYNRAEICRHTDGLCTSGCQLHWFGRSCDFASLSDYEASLRAIGGALSDARKLIVHLQQMMLVCLFSCSLLYL